MKRFLQGLSGDIEPFGFRDSLSLVLVAPSPVARIAPRAAERGEPQGLPQAAGGVADRGARGAANTALLQRGRRHRALTSASTIAGRRLLPDRQSRPAQRQSAAHQVFFFVQSRLTLIGRKPYFLGPRLSGKGSLVAQGSVDPPG